MPEQGFHPDQLRDSWGTYSGGDVDWRGGRSWSLVYDSPAWHAELVDDAAARFAHENGLSHSAFPSAARFESETISMVSSVVAPDTRTYGVFTSGGTESLMVAVKAYRDSTGRREMVLPNTAHPGYWKAAAYLGLTVRHIKVGSDGLPNVTELVDAIGPETAMVGLSAPCFPFGVVDPIEEVAAAAQERGVGLHVDAAMGGLFLPFLPGAGGPTIGFGPNVPGVTSVSVDLHKYGYGAKGASVVLFATRELRHHSYYVATGWPGGAYAASAVVGTRPVGAAAAAWTAVAALGHEGYQSLVNTVMDTARRLQEGMTGAGLQLVGSPPMGVFAVTTPGLELSAVASGLQRRGWWIDTQDDPPAMHFVVFPRHAAVADRFVHDIRDAVQEAEDGVAASGPQASYGVMVRGGEPTEQLLKEHLDGRFDNQGAA
ncbi:MAG TPA: aminotransferase class V-fold PLP-dependent enzyme [Ornithinimicrobium sp.]|uniref:pyridoxal phosphate-dependent decarboxylase family protein n=1 Tax=Ornithinimicrobium sp. TaxID=1977084 RepID=UPI002B486A1D|nr:aminotransferase class V-fold PLP-dependent enzyme [Ornithinimicrobium sp.]HKJ11637.1 aminotransferase class V-fold PLP-dependent enzyme [Ornithinimicrobium sp.]